MTYHSCDKCKGTSVVFDWAEIVTVRQVSVEDNICSNVLSGIHRVVCPAHAVDGGLVLRQNCNGSVNVNQHFNTCTVYLSFEL